MDFEVSYRFGGGCRQKMSFKAVIGLRDAGPKGGAGGADCGFEGSVQVSKIGKITIIVKFLSGR